MSKVGGTYPPLIHGVSEQKPQYRRQGQVTEQVNMLSDPVHGLARRRGSRWLDETTVTSHANAQAEARLMGEFTFIIEGVEYSLLYRKTASLLPSDKFLILYDKTNNKFIDITYESSTWVSQLISGGVSALTCVGRYVYLAGNTTIPTIVTTDRWSTTANRTKLAAWVRAGTYSRKYTVTVYKSDGTPTSVTYETKPSAYPELLDTSDIDFYEVDGITPRPDYQKDVNDRVNEYNGNVSAWVKEAAEDIQPTNIAQKLVDLLVLAGVAATRVEGTVCVDDSEYVNIEADDNGDNTTFVAVGQEVTDPQRVTRHHYVGKVVRVRPRGGTDEETYYLEARNDSGLTGWQPVTWYEAAGALHTPSSMFAQLIIHDGEGYVAENGAGLEVLAPTSGEHPDFKPSVVGDGASSPVPYFFGRQITWMSVFQDRLMVGSGGTVSSSRTGDYLNFFRRTVLSVLDNDPVEAFAFGSEGDTLRASVEYDKSLIIFGDKRQYGIPGSQLFTPRAPLITNIGAHENGTDAPPVAAGNFVFHGKYAEDRTSLHQLQYGQLLQSPVSYEVSPQLDQYIKGRPIQMCQLTAPNFILFRTDGEARTFYTFRYLDDQGGGQRLFDSWSRWEYAEGLGVIIGVSTYQGSALIFTMRVVGGVTYVVADKCSTSAGLDTAPYFDSQRALSDTPGWHNEADGLSVAANASSEYFLLGGPREQAEELIEEFPGIETALVVGMVSPGMVTPTNPFVMDSQSRPVLTGRLTLTGVTIDLVDTGGVLGFVTRNGVERQALTFEARVIGDSDNLLARQPLHTGQVRLGIGAEARDCSWTLRTVDWLPLTVSGVDWTGQHFNRVRRVS